MSQMKTRWPMGHAEKRVLLHAGLAGTSVVIAIVSALLLWQSGVSAARSLAAMTSVDDVRSQCATLENMIDSLVEQSRAEKSLFPVVASEGHTTVPVLATNCGLALIEYSVSTPAGKRSKSGENRWRMLCTGSARSWGRFLSSIAHSSSQMSIETGTWSAKGVADRDVRGDLTLVVNR